MCKIVPKLSKMHQEIHKKSLRFTLAENSSKTQKAVKLLMSMAFLVGLISLIFTLLDIRKTYVIIIAILLVYIAFLCYTILQLWQTRKKIKQKLNKL